MDMAEVRARVLAALDDPRGRRSLLRALDYDSRATHFAAPPESTMRDLIDRRHTEIEEEHDEYLAAIGQDDAVVPPSGFGRGSSDHSINNDEVAERVAAYESLRRDQAAYRLQTAFRMKKFGRMQEFGEDTTAIIKALGLDEGAALPVRRQGRRRGPEGFFGLRSAFSRSRRHTWRVTR